MKHGPGPERAGHLWHVLDAHSRSGHRMVPTGDRPPNCLAKRRTSAVHSRGRENVGERHGREDLSEMRADPESEERIAQAAAARQQSVSTFVLAAAVREADVVLARADVTLMPVEQFDALMDSLEIPDQVPRLLEAASRRGTWSGISRESIRASNCSTGIRVTSARASTMSASRTAAASTKVDTDC